MLRFAASLSGRLSSAASSRFRDQTGQRVSILARGDCETSDKIGVRSDTPSLFTHGSAVVRCRSGPRYLLRRRFGMGLVVGGYLLGRVSAPGDMRVTLSNDACDGYASGSRITPDVGGFSVGLDSNVPAYPLPVDSCAISQAVDYIPASGDYGYYYTYVNPVLDDVMIVMSQDGKTFCKIEIYQVNETSVSFYYKEIALPGCFTCSSGRSGFIYCYAQQAASNHLRQSCSALCFIPRVWRNGDEVEPIKKHVRADHRPDMLFWRNGNTGTLGLAKARVPR